MQIIFPSKAEQLWGNSASRLSGVTILVNDPPQFLDHYYHFAAELLFGLWRTYSSLDPSINAAGQTQLPTPARLMFPHVAAGKWNDYAKMNSFITRAIFPAMSYEYQSDFLDRVDTQRAYVFDRTVFADRGAAFRGDEFARTWRTASEAMALSGSRFWWSPLRRNLLEFVGQDRLPIQDFGFDEDDDLTGDDIRDSPTRRGIEIDSPVFDKDAKPQEPKTAKDTSLVTRKEHSPGNPVITYVSRQDWGRRMLRKEDDATLVRELKALETKYGWEVSCCLLSTANVIRSTLSPWTSSLVTSRFVLRPALLS